MDIKDILDFTHSFIWAFVIIFLIVLFFRPLRSLLSTLDTIVKHRGLKITSSGVEIPSPSLDIGDWKDMLSHHEKKDIFHPENIEEPLLEKEGSKEEILEHHEPRLVDDVFKAIQFFIDQKTQREGSSLKKKDKNQLEISILENLLCDAYISLYFERCFQKLVASHIKFLCHLLHLPLKTCGKSEALHFFNKDLINVPIADFDEWFGYLEKIRFIQSKEDDVYLTAEGKEFIHYIHKRKYVFEKNSSSQA